MAGETPFHQKGPDPHFEKLAGSRRRIGRADYRGATPKNCDDRQLRPIGFA